MKLAVFGASGGTGRHIVRLALDQGHEVTAFTRNLANVTMTHERLRVVQGDVLDAGVVEAAVKGQDAVICSLGTMERGPSTVVSEGTRNIIAAMEGNGVERFVCLSSAGIIGGELGFFFDRVIAPRVFKHVFADKRRQLDVMRQSSVDWVLVRPPELTDDPGTGKYEVRFERVASRKIPRADVADFMLKQLDDDRYVGKMPLVSS